MKKVFIDIIPVLIGILLALFINNWRQSVSDKKYIQNSISAIVEENKANMDELKYAMRRQRQILDTLNRYMEDDNVSLAQAVHRGNGLYTPDLKSITWTFLVQDSKHTLVTYDYISKLADIEKYESLISRYNIKVNDIFYQPAYYSDPALKRVCQGMINDLIGIENNFMSALEAFNDYAATQKLK